VTRIIAKEETHPRLEGGPSGGGSSRRRALSIYRSRARRGEALLAGLLLLPALALLAVVVFYPLVQALLLSVRDASLLNAAFAPFTGLDNFVRLLQDAVFWQATRNTFVLTFISITGALALGMALALLLNENLPFRNFFRGLALVPWVTPGVVLALLFIYMFNSQVGIVNYALAQLGLTEGFVNWFGSTRNALWVVAFANIWHQAPFYMLMILAGLQTVPQELYEAAKVDGASAVQRFWHITLPGIRGILSIVVILQVIWNFNNFDLIWAMTQGGPVNSTTTLAIYVYRSAFVNTDIGYAAAIGLVLLVFLAVFAALYIWRTERGESR